MKILTTFISFLFQNLVFFSTLITMVLCFFEVMPITAQNKELLIGNWQLQKVSYQNSVVQNSETNKEQLLRIFKAALYNQLTNEQKLNFNDLEQLQVEAKKLLDIYYQSKIEFKSNGVFYNSSQNQTKSLSGEYLFRKKKLLLEWETADKNNFKIITITADEFVLEDIMISLFYNKLQQKELDEKAARLKKAKELECTKPGIVRIEAITAAKEKNQITKTK